MADYNVIQPLADTIDRRGQNMNMGIGDANLSPLGNYIEGYQTAQNRALVNRNLELQMQTEYDPEKLFQEQLQRELNTKIVTEQLQAAERKNRLGEAYDEKQILLDIQKAQASIANINTSTANTAANLRHQQMQNEAYAKYGMAKEQAEFRKKQADAIDAENQARFSAIKYGSDARKAALDAEAAGGTASKNIIDAEKASGGVGGKSNDDAEFSKYLARKAGSEQLSAEEIIRARTEWQAAKDGVPVAKVDPAPTNIEPSAEATTSKSQTITTKAQEGEMPAPVQPAPLPTKADIVNQQARATAERAASSLSEAQAMDQLMKQQIAEDDISTTLEMQGRQAALVKSVGYSNAKALAAVQDLDATGNINSTALFGGLGELLAVSKDKDPVVSQYAKQKMSQVIEYAGGADTIAQSVQQSAKIPEVGVKQAAMVYQAAIESGNLTGMSQSRQDLAMTYGNGYAVAQPEVAHADAIKSMQGKTFDMSNPSNRSIMQSKFYSAMTTASKQGSVGFTITKAIVPQGNSSEAMTPVNGGGGMAEKWVLTPEGGGSPVYVDITNDPTEMSQAIVGQQIGAQITKMNKEAAAQAAAAANPQQVTYSDGGLQQGGQAMPEGEAVTDQEWMEVGGKKEPVPIQKRSSLLPQDLKSDAVVLDFFKQTKVRSAPVIRSLKEKARGVFDVLQDKKIDSGWILNSEDEAKIGNFKDDLLGALWEDINQPQNTTVLKQYENIAAIQRGKIAEGLPKPALAKMARDIFIDRNRKTYGKLVDDYLNIAASKIKSKDLFAENKIKEQIATETNPIKKDALMLSLESLKSMEE